MRVCWLAWESCRCHWHLKIHSFNNGDFWLVRQRLNGFSLFFAHFFPPIIYLSDSIWLFSCFRTYSMRLFRSLLVGWPLIYYPAQRLHPPLAQRQTHVQIKEREKFIIKCCWMCTSSEVRNGITVVCSETEPANWVRIMF